jgi:hypothetical protein
MAVYYFNYIWINAMYARQWRGQHSILEIANSHIAQMKSMESIISLIIRIPRRHI